MPTYKFKLGQRIWFVKRGWIETIYTNNEFDVGYKATNEEYPVIDHTTEKSLLGQKDMEILKRFLKTINKRL